MDTQTNSQEKENLIKAPELTLPKGGGAISGIGETFKPDPFSGTGNYAIPIPVTKARGLEPQLAIQYNSGAGNSPFGIGFSLNLSKISVRTDKGIPKYQDNTIYTADGAELTPQLIKNENSWEIDIRTEVCDEQNWEVTNYVPRVEGAFSKTEHWKNRDTAESYWKITTKENTTHLYGRTKNARIFDSENTDRIFEWLIEESIDNHGNKITYTYKEENRDNLTDAISEKGHFYNNRYLSNVKYGNYTDDAGIEQFAFEVVFDYGEYDISDLDKGKKDPYKPAKKWNFLIFLREF